MPKKRSRSQKKEPKVEALFGIGLDGEDGHRRITQTEEMTIVGGSHETHERMQETAIRFGEQLEKSGKTLPETTVREAIDLLREAVERTGR